MATSVIDDTPAPDRPAHPGPRAGGSVADDAVLWLIVVGGGLVGLGLAGMAGLTPLLAVAVPAVSSLAYLAVRRPVVALVVLQVMAWSGVSGVAGNHNGFSLYTGALAIGAISLLLGMRRDGRQPFSRSPIYLLVALVAFTQALSLLATSYPPPSLSTPVSHLLDVVFFVVTIGLLRLTGRYRTAVIVIVATIAILAALTVVQQFALHNTTTFGGLSNVPVGPDIGSATARHSGPEADVNFWGRTIVLAFGLCAALVVTTRSARPRLVWGVAATALVAGEYLTSSRGGLIALFVVLVSWLVVVFRRRLRYLLLLPVVGGALVLVTPGLSSRLSTLTELTSVSQATTDPSLLGRVQAQEVGLAMFRANPEFGVGDGNFTTAEPHFLGQPGIVQTGSILAPHDLYLELAAEQGIVGLAAWVLFFGGALVVAVRSAILARRLALDDLGWLATGTVIGLVGWAVASLFLHLSDFNDLLAIVALAATLDMEVRDATPEGFSSTYPAPVARRPPVAAVERLTVALRLGVPLAIGVVVLALGSVLVPPRTTMFRAQATAAVSPNAALPPGESAYTWYTIDGGVLLPTFAGIATSLPFVATAEHRPPSVQVTASGNPLSSVLQVTAVASSASSASAVSRTALANARAYLQSLAPLYTIQPVASGAVTSVQEVRPVVAAIYGALAVASLAATIVRGRVTLRRWRRSRLGLSRADGHRRAPARASS